MTESPERHLLGVIAEDDEPLAYADRIFPDRAHAKRVILGYLQQGLIAAIRHGEPLPQHTWRSMLDDSESWNPDSPDRVTLTSPNPH